MLSLFLTSTFSILILTLSFASFREVFLCFEIVEKAEEEEMALRRIAGVEVSLRNVHDIAQQLKVLVPGQDTTWESVEESWRQGLERWRDERVKDVGPCLLWLGRVVCSEPHMEEGEPGNWRVAWRWEDAR